MMEDTPQSKSPGRSLVLTLVIAAVVFFGGGLIIAFALGMTLIDQVAFLFCLGVVFLLAATGYTVWRGGK